MYILQSPVPEYPHVVCSIIFPH